MSLALQVLRILGAQRHPAGACTPALLATCSTLELCDQPLGCCSALDSILCDAGTVATLHVACEAWADDGGHGVMWCRASAAPAVRASSQRCMRARSAGPGGACGMSPTTWVRSCTDSCTRPLGCMLAQCTSWQHVRYTLCRWIPSRCDATSCVRLTVPGKPQPCW